MRADETHLADEELLLVADGEAADELERQVRAHIAMCSSCRERMLTIEDSIAVVVREQRDRIDARIPPGDVAKARLLRRMADVDRSVKPNWRWAFVAGAAACVAAMLLLIMAPFRGRDAHAKPRHNLTPGAVAARNREQVCAANPENNRVVPVALQRRVFEEYGIPNAQPQAYEVDYLITPALGGADDIHNLWPQPYASTVWNAKVKDDLEQYLRDQVCSGRLDLATAQREIADDWIAAYKRHFRTNHPN